MLFAAGGLGLAVGLFPWGLATDAIGERRALSYGLAACGVLIGAAAFTDDPVVAGALFAASAAAGASVQSASGRAVMQWFGPAERGLAFGIRQTAVPFGGVIAALALPAIADGAGLPWAFVFLGLFCVTSATVGALVVRELPSEGVDPHDVPWTLRDTSLWLLSAASSLYVAAQVTLFIFLVLFLHDEQGLSATAAAAVLAAAHALAMAARIAAGRWSDLVRSRIVPLRAVGVSMTASIAGSALLLDGPIAVVVPLLVGATVLSASWNGLAFVAAAELAGAGRSGAAIGFQQTALAVTCVVVPPVFATVVDASSWRTAFFAFALAPLLGWMLLGRVRV